MTKAEKKKGDEQLRAFRKAAREFGCEDNEARFKAALRAVGKAKPSQKTEKRRPHR